MKPITNEPQNRLFGQSRRPAAICPAVWGVAPAEYWPANVELAGTSAAVAAKSYTQMWSGRGSCPVTSSSRLVTLVEAHPAATTMANKLGTIVANVLRSAEGS